MIRMKLLMTRFKTIVNNDSRKTLTASSSLTAASGVETLFMSNFYMQLQNHDLKARCESKVRIIN